MHRIFNNFVEKKAASLNNAVVMDHPVIVVIPHIKYNKDLSQLFVGRHLCSQRKADYLETAHTWTRRSSGVRVFLRKRASYNVMKPLPTDNNNSVNNNSNNNNVFKWITESYLTGSAREAAQAYAAAEVAVFRKKEKDATLVFSTSLRPSPSKPLPSWEEICYRHQAMTGEDRFCSRVSLLVSVVLYNAVL